MNKAFWSGLLARLTSRKFLLAVVGLVTVFFADKLSTEQLTAITALIVAFTAAEGAADVVRATHE